MVRINRTYSIEQDLVEKLKDESNNSELINNLLEAHFNRANSKDLQHLKRELGDLESNMDAQRKERDAKVDVIREIENKAVIDNDAVAEDELKKEVESNIQKNLMGLVKEKKLDFENYRKFKTSSDFVKAKTDLFYEKITLEEYKQIEADFLKIYFEKLEQERDHPKD